MRFCPLIGEKGCREDCLFRLDPERKFSDRQFNLFIDSWEDEQRFCGLLMALSAAMQSLWKDGRERRKNMADALLFVQEIGAENFLPEIKAMEDKYLPPDILATLLGAARRRRERENSSRDKSR